VYFNQHVCCFAAATSMTFFSKNFSILPLNAAILVHFEPDFYYSATLFLRKKQCFGPLGVKIF